MDFWRTVVVLFRRWYITVPAFFASLGLAGLAYSAMPVEYQSGSILVLTTPLSGATQATAQKAPSALTNPLLNFDRSLSLTAAIVIQEMNSSEMATAMGFVPGSTTNYEVTNGSTNPELLESGPFIFVQGTGESPQEAQDIATRVAAMAARVLAQRQSDLKAPLSTQITVQRVVPATAGQPLSANPKRAAAASGALAVIASLVAAYGFESYRDSRRRRRLDRLAAEAAVTDISTPPQRDHASARPVGVPGQRDAVPTPSAVDHSAPRPRGRGVFRRRSELTAEAR